MTTDDGSTPEAVIVCTYIFKAATDPAIFSLHHGLTQFWVILLIAGLATFGGMFVIGLSVYHSCRGGGGGGGGGFSGGGGCGGGGGGCGGGGCGG